MVRSVDDTSHRDAVYGLAVAAETIAKLLIAGESVGDAAGEVLLTHVITVKQGLGLGGERPRSAPDRDALEHAIAQELDDAGEQGLTVAEVVQRLWTDFADRYAHRASLRKAAYETLSTLVDAGAARGEGTGRRGQGARYYVVNDQHPAPVAEGAPCAATATH